MDVGSPLRQKPPLPLNESAFACFHSPPKGGAVFRRKQASCSDGSESTIKKESGTVENDQYFCPFVSSPLLASFEEYRKKLLCTAQNVLCEAPSFENAPMPDFASKCSSSNILNLSLNSLSESGGFMWNTDSYPVFNKNVENSSSFGGQFADTSARFTSVKNETFTENQKSHLTPDCTAFPNNCGKYVHPKISPVSLYRINDDRTVRYRKSISSDTKENIIILDDTDQSLRNDGMMRPVALGNDTNPDTDAASIPLKTNTDENSINEKKNKNGVETTAKLIIGSETDSSSTSFGTLQVKEHATHPSITSKIQSSSEMIPNEGNTKKFFSSLKQFYQLVNQEAKRCLANAEQHAKEQYEQLLSKERQANEIKINSVEQEVAAALKNLTEVENICYKQKAQLDLIMDVHTKVRCRERRFSIQRFTLTGWCTIVRRRKMNHIRDVLLKSLTRQRQILQAFSFWRRHASCRSEFKKQRFGATAVQREVDRVTQMFCAAQAKNESKICALKKELESERTLRTTLQKNICLLLSGTGKQQLLIGTPNPLDAMIPGLSVNAEIFEKAVSQNVQPYGHRRQASNVVPRTGRLVGRSSFSNDSKNLYLGWLPRSRQSSSAKMQPAQQNVSPKHIVRQKGQKTPKSNSSNIRQQGKTKLNDLYTTSANDFTETSSNSVPYTSYRNFLKANPEIMDTGTSHHLPKYYHSSHEGSYIIDVNNSHQSAGYGTQIYRPWARESFQNLYSETSRVGLPVCTNQPIDNGRYWEFDDSRSYRPLAEFHFSAPSPSVPVQSRCNSPRIADFEVTGTCMPLMPAVKSRRQVSKQPTRTAPASASMNDVRHLWVPGIGQYGVLEQTKSSLATLSFSENDAFTSVGQTCTNYTSKEDRWANALPLLCQKNTGKGH